MIIRDIQTGSISLPLARPFKTALRTVERVEDVAVRILTDTGEVGYGEAPPTAVITGDTTGSILCAIRDFIRPSLLGMDIEDMEGIQRKLHSCILHNTSAKAAVDMALYDLWAKRWNAPLWKLLGGSKPTFETDITISVNPVDEMVADSLDAVRRGFHILKVKVGKEGKKDVERIAAIRKAIGPDVLIRVDANQGWDPRQSVAIISAMEDKGLDIELVEQPVKATDLDGLRYVTQRVQTPILADEAVFSPADGMKIITTGAADLINIKLMKTGGIWQALKLCAIAQSHGVRCMTGCMLESKLAVTAAAHLCCGQSLAVTAAAHLCCGQSIVTMADLDGPSLCAVDPFEGGPIFHEATVTMTDAPGLGITKVPVEDWRS